MQVDVCGMPAHPFTSLRSTSHDYWRFADLTLHH